MRRGASWLLLEDEAPTNTGQEDQKIRYLEAFVSPTCNVPYKYSQPIICGIHPQASANTVARARELSPLRCYRYRPAISSRSPEHLQPQPRHESTVLTSSATSILPRISPPAPSTPPGAHSTLRHTDRPEAEAEKHHSPLRRWAIRVG